MHVPTAYHQLGRFIVDFQHLENSVRDLLLFMANTDDEVVRILTTRMRYAGLVDASEVLFTRFIEIRNNANATATAEFHELVVELHKLGGRRNQLVHSLYNTWFDLGGDEGLFRQNSSLKKGERVENEEELQPNAFDDDLERLERAAERLEAFRLRVIDWS